MTRKEKSELWWRARKEDFFFLVRLIIFFPIWFFAIIGILFGGIFDKKQKNK